jgi:membrane fusion protein (multidrug efflux system)
MDLHQPRVNGLKACWKLAAIASLWLVCWAFLPACEQPRAATQPSTAALKEYPVMTVAPRDVTLHIDVPASVLGKQVVEIRPMIDGYVEAMSVDEGAWVKAGQELFRIKAPQYEQALRTAEAGIKTAEADVNAARMNSDKVKPLVDKQIISQYELRAAQYQLESKEAALAQARAALANARTNLSYTRISSPVDGVIGNLPFKIGSLVSSAMTDPLTTVSNIEEVYAYFSVNEKIVLSLTRDIAGNSLQEKLSKMADVQFIMADGKLYDQPGRVVAASGLIDRDTGSTNFRATFPNPRGQLRSGASGQVRVPRPTPNALLVPQSAAYELQGKHFVYRIEQGDRVKQVEIKVRATPDGQFYVVESGLQANDRVVLDGLASLQNDSVIKPVPKEVAVPATSKAQ